MKILLYAEKDLAIDLKSIVKNLNGICKHLRFQSGDSNFQIFSRQISHPSSYESLSRTIIRKAQKVDYTFLFSGKQYDNNYFYETYDSKAIVSFFGWQQLTSLSKNNGVVFFIADLIALKIDNSFRHDNETGCIYDFGWNKTGIDLEMRNAFICPKCLNRISSRTLSKEDRGLFADLRDILDVLGKASKWNKDIVQFWQNLPGSNKKNSTKRKRSIGDGRRGRLASKYDVFLAHNSSDKPFVEVYVFKVKWTDSQFC